MRTRDGRPVAGRASARPPLVLGSGGGDFVSFPFYGPWGYFYPWYTGTLGWDLGFVGYNPWRFGATRWFYGPYGLWYDPYTYYWDPFWGTSSYSRGDSEPKVKSTTGSLRIKANLDTAMVYIDGAVTGRVDEFNGLKDHLEIEGGRHTIEIKADGFETFKQEIDVRAGKTETVRAKLKEKK